MSKPDADDWKTPLGYYERAIAELRRAHGEIQAELQNLKQNQTSQVELQNLKAELQTTKEHLATTQKTSDDAHTELQALKEQLQNLKEPMPSSPSEDNAQSIEELSQIKKQLSELQSQLQQIEQQQSFFKDYFKTLIHQSLLQINSHVSKLSDELTLISSASGTDYTKLRNLLKEGNWKEADQETLAIMWRISNRGNPGWRFLDDGDIQRFPWQDLRIINRLWIEYSNGRFGFSVQKQIWNSIQVPKNNDFEVEKTLGDRVGWRVNNNWVKYDELTFAISASEGHLPATLHLLGVEAGRVEHRVKLLFSHRKDL